MVQMDEGSKNKVLDDAEVEPSRSMSVAASLFKKSVSSLVVFSYLSLSLSQSFAMERNKVVPFDGNEGIELDRDRKEPHDPSLPHHRTYGSVYGGSVS